jgi:predicted dehydrogenase
MRGSLAVPTMRLKTYAGERSWWKPLDEDIVDVDRAAPHARQLEHFCSVIRGETQPSVGGRDGLQTLRVTLAIYEAAQTGRPVHIPLAENAAETMNKDVR